MAGRVGRDGGTGGFFLVGDFWRDPLADCVLVGLDRKLRAHLRYRFPGSGRTHHHNQGDRNQDYFRWLGTGFVCFLIRAFLLQSEKQRVDIGSFAVLSGGLSVFWGRELWLVQNSFFSFRFYRARLPDGRDFHISGNCRRFSLLNSFGSGGGKGDIASWKLADNLACG